MKNLRYKNSFSRAFVLGAAIILSGRVCGYGETGSAKKDNAVSIMAAPASTISAPTAPAAPAKPKYVRGVHVTSWIAGSSKMRQQLDKLVEETEINTLVIDIKEYEGEIYVPGYDKADKYKTYVKAISDFDKYIASLKKRNIYLIARIVVFKDALLPKRRPDLAVQSATGGMWKDHAGLTWLDPYNKENWDYNIGLAEHAVKLGFDEVQFDYIRFPSDGHTRNCRYKVKHSSATADAAITGFLEEANKRIKPLGANMSIDVFGLTVVAPGDMGIGQKIIDMARWADFVSPMVYPSHYAKGEYGMPDPNKEPYHTVYVSLESAKKRIPASKLRPYLQDFSLGVHYGAKEVHEQIQACYDNDVAEWILWNPRCVYTRGALKNKEFQNTYNKMPLPAYITNRKPKHPPAASVHASTTTALTPEIYSGTIKEEPLKQPTTSPATQN